MYSGNPEGRIETLERCTSVTLAHAVRGIGAGEIGRMEGIYNGCESTTVYMCISSEIHNFSLPKRF